ncbi:phosphotransferase [Actinomadura sp. HBU206391]|uniref:phosphotransferase n=1 Tax=Actinomadura sp. HBU206391 TaxID=2731692 RepID=UPI00164F67FB|nr:phosphotransferase [Actinomadura sp. HBU206391]MBC6456499.1 phosphotransferase [Actinomadura sp. HBU206391]
MTDLSWRDVLATHYHHAAPEFLHIKRSYSLHFIYRFSGKKYVLSKVRKDPRRIPFHFQFDITELLSLRSETVRRAEPPVTPSSGPWVDIGSHHWFVRPYIEHDPAPDWRKPLLIRAAAHHLARIHEIAESSPNPLGEVQDGLAPYHWPICTVLAEQNAFAADMILRGRPRRDVATVRRNLETLGRQAAEVELGLTGITHQDFRPGNILVRGGAVTGIIDWDLAHEDRYLYDAALGALHLGCHQAGSDHLSAAQLFMDVYLDRFDVKAGAEAVPWMFRFITTRNLAVGRSPGKWRGLLREVEARWPRTGTHRVSRPRELVSADTGSCSP